MTFESRLTLRFFIYCLFLFLLLPTSGGSLLLSAEEKIPACLLSYRFGPEQYVVVVEKSTQSLFIYSNYKAEPVETFTITTGKINGQKLEEGDMKTPEGIYFFRRILIGDQLPKVDDYGEKAFTMNYPNPMDRKAKRNGSGIWLHGAFDENKTNVANNSRGCVVLKNDDLVKVSKYIFLNQTPICIYDKIRYISPEEIIKKREQLIHHLKKWKECWEKKDIDGYIGYYDNRFRYRNMGLSQFRNYKNALNKRYTFIRVMLSDINLYSFDGYHVVSFNQLYVSDVNHFYSRKIQYWSHSENYDKAGIVEEDTIPLSEPPRFEIEKGNFMTIDEFRKSYLDHLEQSTQTLSPYDIRLENITITDKNVALTLTRPTNAENLKVVPVLRFQHKTDNTIHFTSLKDITLENGMPQDYTKGIVLQNTRTIIHLENVENYILKRLTLILVDSDNNWEQILTYFVNKEK